MGYGVAWKPATCRRGGKTADPRHLAFCAEHDDVITLGRRQTGPRQYYLLRRFPIFEIERGGGTTYHRTRGSSSNIPSVFCGPDPIRRNRFHCRLDLHGFLRAIEEGLLHLLRLCGVACDRKPNTRAFGLLIRRANWCLWAWRFVAG